MSEKDDVEIVMPSLAEIIVSLRLPDQINEREEGQLPPAKPITESEKRKVSDRWSQSQVEENKTGN